MLGEIQVYLLLNFWIFCIFLNGFVNFSSEVGHLLGLKTTNQQKPQIAKREAHRARKLPWNSQGQRMPSWIKNGAGCTKTRWNDPSEIISENSWEDQTKRCTKKSGGRKSPDHGPTATWKKSTTEFSKNITRNSEKRRPKQQTGGSTAAKTLPHLAPKRRPWKVRTLKNRARYCYYCNLLLFVSSNTFSPAFWRSN